MDHHYAEHDQRQSRSQTEKEKSWKRSRLQQRVRFRQNTSKTCGRGQKGQKARNTGGHPTFEGGQSPLQRRIPKRGYSKNRFNNYKPLAYASLGKIVYCIDKGRIDPTQVIEMKHLKQAGVCTKIIHGVKLVGRGGEELKRRNLKLNLELSQASRGAAKLVTELGGSVKLLHHTRLTLRSHIRPDKFKIQPKIPIPSPKKLLKMEKMREELGKFEQEQGVDVEYPMPSWYEEQKEEIAERKQEYRRKIEDSPDAIYLKEVPVDRHKEQERPPRKQRDTIQKKIYFKKD